MRKSANRWHTRSCWWCSVTAEPSDRPQPPVVMVPHERLDDVGEVAGDAAPRRPALDRVSHLRISDIRVPHLPIAMFLLQTSLLFTPKQGLAAQPSIELLTCISPSPSSRTAYKVHDTGRLAVVHRDFCHCRAAASHTSSSVVQISCMPGAPLGRFAGGPSTGAPNTAPSKDHTSN